MMHTHQFHKTAQLRLLEIVEFPVETTSYFPLVARVLMQCECVIMQFETRSMNICRCGTLSASVSGKVLVICLNHVLDVSHQGTV
jgi:hypothetical protein